MQTIRMGGIGSDHPMESNKVDEILEFVGASLELGSFLEFQTGALALLKKDFDSGFGIFIGLLTSLVAFAELVYAVYTRLFTSTVVPGWASAISILSFLFGVLFILVGLLGEYIGRILVEVQHRPRFLVSDQVGIKNLITDDSIRYRYRSHIDV